MITRIDYRHSSSELIKAWFEYKNSHPGTTLSVVSFAAGWNAAKGVFTNARN